MSARLSGAMRLGTMLAFMVAACLPPRALAAEAEQGIPHVGEAERVLEREIPEPEPETFINVPAEPEPAAAAPAASPSPADNVLEITEKPANPRRGWWQRLMQQ